MQIYKFIVDLLKLKVEYFAFLINTGHHKINFRENIEPKPIKRNCLQKVE